MSEHEKYEQVGRLAEEVSRLKGELNQITEKLNRAFFAYNRMTQSGMINNWSTINGQLNIPHGGQYPSNGAELEALLNKHQLVEVLEHKQRLTSELNAAAERLKGLAPHLL
jgi:hypothetical protein